jgi:hypothetical protein
MSVRIEPRPDGRYRVVVEDGGTEHVVSVPEEMRGDPQLGADLERLVRASFEFLLEREPAASVMRAFSLDVIPRYFPEYPAEIRRRLGAA